MAPTARGMEGALNPGFTASYMAPTARGMGEWRHAAGGGWCRESSIFRAYRRRHKRVLTLKTSTHKGDLIRGWSASGDLFASIVAGLLIGLGIDYWFGTSPIFVVILIVVASYGGFRRMYTESEKIEEQAREAIRIRNGL